MRGLIKDVERTHGGLSPLLLIDTTDGGDISIPRRHVSRSTFRNATLVLAKKDDGTIHGIAKVTSFTKDGKPETIRPIVGSRFTLEELEEIKDCR